MKTAEDAMDVAGARREIVCMVERLHTHDMAEPAQGARERLREVPVAPAGRDFLGWRGDRERDTQPAPGERRGVPHERRTVLFDVGAPPLGVRRERPCEGGGRSHGPMVDDDRVRYRDDPTAARPEPPAQPE